MQLKLIIHLIPQTISIVQRKFIIQVITLITLQDITITIMIIM